MDIPGGKIWSEVSEAFGRLRGMQVRDLWLRDARPHSFSRGLFTLDVFDAAKKQAIDSCYRADLEEIFREITGSPVRLRTRVSAPAAPAGGLVDDQGGSGPVAAGDPRRGRGRRVTAAPVLPTLQSARFAVSPANELAHAAGMRLVQPGQHGFHALFVHGPAGSGKTALAGEVLRLLAETDPACDPLVLSGETLSRDVSRASHARTFGALQRRWAAHDAIVLDEAHRLRGQRVAQTVAVSLLAPVLARGGRVLVLSRHAPRDIQGLDERLVSHFESGLVVALRQPDDADRAAVLRAVCENLPAVVPADAFDAVCERCPGTLTEAVDLLRRVAAVAASSGREVLLSDLEPRLARGAGGLRNLDALVNLVCAETGVSAERLRSAEKSRDVAILRHLCVYVASRSLGLSSRQICRSLRLRSPSIVAYSRRAVERRRGTDPEFERLIHTLQARLAGAQRDFEW